MSEKFSSWIGKTKKTRGPRMPIKHVVIHKPIQLVNPSTKKRLKKSPETEEELALFNAMKPEQRPDAEPVTTYKVVSNLLADARWAKGYKKIKSAMAIDQAFNTEDQVVKIADDDLKALVDQINEPGESGYGFAAFVMPQLLPLLESIIDAKDADPTVPATAPVEAEAK